MIARFFIVVCSHLITASGPTTLIRVSRGNYRFPIEYTRVEGNETFRGYGSISLKEPYFALQHCSNAGGPVQARSITIVDTEMRLDFLSPSPVFGSSLAHRNMVVVDNNVGDILLTPVSDVDGLIVI